MAMGYTALTRFDTRVTQWTASSAGRSDTGSLQIKHSENEFAIDEIITTSVLDN